MSNKKDSSNSPESDPIDAHELLAKHRMIGVIWCIEDVQAVRPDLSDDQAWKVLQTVERRHDAEYGINWTTLEIFADEMFPKRPTKRTRP